jgi:acetolactate synthase regulatory subunit
MVGYQVDNVDEQTRTNIHALSVIRNHGFSVQAIKGYASDLADIGTGVVSV